MLSEKQKLAHELKSDLMPEKFGVTGRIWVGVLVLFCLWGLYAYFRQFQNGLIVTDMRDYSSWGIYISNFVFFVAVSLVGSLMSAILKLAKAEWRIPLTRISEILAVSAIIFAGLIIIVDMGRPDRILNLFLYGRIQSPIIWDVIVISTYLAISLLLLYIPLIPDITITHLHLSPQYKLHKKLLKLLSLNWKGIRTQYFIIHKAIAVLSIFIIPVALGIHTVTSWLFATTFRSGWDSTNFGAYFVSGAFMVGAATVIAAMYIIRKQYKFEKYITLLHFDHMGKLLVLLSLIYLYFNINEYLVPAYKMKLVERVHLESLFTGSFAHIFWPVQIFGMVIPIIVLLFKVGRKPLPAFIISIMVIIGAWFKRFLIVIPTLLHPFVPIQNVPESWHEYIPTWEEWAITLGSISGALLIITLFIRLFPIIPIWELAEEKDCSKELLNI